MLRLQEQKYRQKTLREASKRERNQNGDRTYPRKDGTSRLHSSLYNGLDDSSHDLLHLLRRLTLHRSLALDHRDRLALRACVGRSVSFARRSSSARLGFGSVRRDVLAEETETQSTTK